MSSPNITFMYFSTNGSNIILSCKCFKKWDLLPKSDVFTPLSKTVSPPLIYSPRIYHNRKQTITVFMNMVQIFGVINENFTSNDIHRSKNISPILHVDSRISFALSSFSFKFDKYFSAAFLSILSLVILVSIHSQTIVSAWSTKSSTLF